MGAAVGHSSVFSLSAAGSRPLAEAASPETGSRLLRWIARVYVWLCAVLGEGALGSTARRAAGSWASSALLADDRERWVGAGLVGLGLGRLLWVAREGEGSGWTIAGVVLALVGLVVAVAGPRLRAAVSRSLPARGFGLLSGLEPTIPRPRVRASGRVSGVVAGGLALAFGAGFLAGAAPGVTWLIVPGIAAVLIVGVAGLLRPELVLLALAAFPWVDFVFGQAAGERQASLDALLLLAAFAGLAFTVLVLRRWELRTVPLTVPLLTMFVFACASVVVAPVATNIAFFALRLTFQAFLFYLLGYLLPKDRVWVRRTITVFLLSALALALHGLFQVATHAPMPAKWVDVHESIATRAYSIVENPNGLGAYLALASLVGAALTLSSLPRRQRIALGCLTAVLVAGLGATFSRGAWIGFAVGLLVLVAMTRLRLFWGIVGAALVSPLVLPRTIVERLTFAFSAAYIGKSLTAGRLYIWQVALQRIAEHPLFGVGLGTFGGTSAFLYLNGRFWIDNYYLQLGAEGGLLLLGAFLWVLLRAAKSLYRASREQTDPYGRAVAAGAFAGFLAVAVANVTASVWETLVVASAFWFLAGFAGSLSAESEGEGLVPLAGLAEEQSG